MAESRDSLLQFDSSILDLNENRPLTETNELFDSVPTISLQNDFSFSEIPNTSETCKSAKLSENCINMYCNEFDETSQNLDVATTRNNDSCVHDSENNLMVENAKLIDFSVEQNFTDNCGVMLSDFIVEENDVQCKDEEFHDAVQFFKDPSSFVFLENAGSSSAPSEPLMARSSLYMNFDPLHAKFFSQSSTKIDELNKIVEDEVEFEILSNHVQDNVALKDIQIDVSSAEFQSDLKPNNASCSLTTDTVQKDIHITPDEAQSDITTYKALNNITPNKSQSDITPNISPSDITPNKSQSDIINEVVNDKAVDLIQSDLTANKVLGDITVKNVQSDIRADEVQNDLLDKVLSDVTIDTVKSEITDKSHSAITSERGQGDITIDTVQNDIAPEKGHSGITMDNDLSEKTAGIIHTNIALDMFPGNSVPDILNKHLSNVSPRHSLGNVLISFDSPIINKDLLPQPIENEANTLKMYTEEELQQAVKIQELTVQESFLKRQHDLEVSRSQKEHELEAKLQQQRCLTNASYFVLKEMYDVTLMFSDKDKSWQDKLEIVEKENSKLKEDLKTSEEDLQSVENTFADFHKRYEQCKSMLKVYVQNEDNFKQQLENMKVQLKERDEMYKELQIRTQEMLDKANTEIANAKKAGDSQVAVLKAQLKKLELKNSSLESDVKHVKIENSKLSSICDELMVKVSEA